MTVTAFVLTRDRKALLVECLRALLPQADRVVVLVEGRVAAVGPWAELEPDWGHLAG